ncbi:hypothetical protein DRO60_03560 [Candidatus Bathyarchaeota archaeon]|nr:MAG: hypothetical protein DRO60_03560 [Candidatus Bathyarchaeota archaeon]
MRSLLAAAALLRYLLCRALNALSGRAPDLVVRGLALALLFLLRLRPRLKVPEDPEVFLAQHGIETRLVPHEIVSDHLACYNIALWGLRIRPEAARRLGIPDGQVWMSEALRLWRHFVLFHEVAEMIFRARGFHGLAGHQLAEEEELLRWHSDPLWLNMNTRRPWPRLHLMELARRLRSRLKGRLRALRR